MKNATQRILIETKEKYKDVTVDPKTGEYFGTTNGEITIMRRNKEEWETEKVDLLEMKKDREGVFEGVNTRDAAKYNIRFVGGEKYKVSPCGTQVVTTEMNARVLTNVLLNKQKDLSWVVRSHQLARAVSYGVLYTNDQEEETSMVSISLSGPFDIRFDFDSKTGKLAISNHDQLLDVFSGNYNLEARFIISVSASFSEFSLLPCLADPQVYNTGIVGAPKIQTSGRILMFDVQENVGKILKELGNNEGVEIIKANDDWSCIYGEFEFDKIGNLAKEHSDGYKVLSDICLANLVTGKAETQNEKLKEFVQKVKGDVKIDQDLEEMVISLKRRVEDLETGEQNISGTGYDKNVYGASEESLSIEYIESGDKLLVIGEKSLKMLSRDTGSFTLNQFLIGESIPQTAQDLVSVSLTRNELLLITRSLNWEEIFESTKSSETYPQVVKLFEAIETALKNGKTTSKIVLTGPVESIFIGFRVISRYINSKLQGEKVEIPTGLLAFSTVEKVVDQTQEEDSDEDNATFGNLFSAKRVQHVEICLSKEDYNLKLEDSDAALGWGIMNKVLRILYRIDEELISRTPGLNLNDTIDTFRGFTAYGRLMSFIRNGETTRNTLQMAEAGLISINQAPLKLGFYGQADRILSGFEDQKYGELDLYQMLSNNDLKLPLTNVPLSVTLNSTPNLSFQEKILSISQNSASGSLAVLFENNILRIYNTSLNLCLMNTSNIREQAVLGIRIGELLKDQTSFLNIGVNISDVVIKDIFSDDKEGDFDPGIVPDKNKLDQLYMMGFPIDLIKKALIETKNDTVEAVIDKISTYHEDELDKKNQPLSEAVSLLKPQWECPFCTFINNTDLEAPEACCQICGNVAPSSAFYTKEEVEKMEKDKKRAIEAETKKEEEIRNKVVAQQEEEHEDNSPEEIKLGSIDAVRFTEFNSNFLDRSLVIAGFNHNSNSAIRFRRYGYQEEYIKSLIKLGKLGKHFFTYIGGYNLNSKTVEEELAYCLKTEDNLLKIDNLIPSITSRDSIIVPVYEHDIRIEDQNIVDIGIVSNLTSDDNMDTIMVRVITKDPADGFYYYSLYKISSPVFNYSTSSFEVEMVGEKSKIELGPEQEIRFIQNSEFLVAGKNIAKFDEQGNLVVVEEIETQDDGSAVAKVKFSNDGFIVLWENGQIQEIKRSKDTRDSQGSKQPTVEEASNPDDITLDQINQHLESKKLVKITANHDENIDSMLLGNGDNEQIEGYGVRAVVYNSKNSLEISPTETISSGILQVNFSFDDVSSSPDTTEDQKEKEGSGEENSMIKFGGSKDSKYIPMRLVDKTLVDNNNASNFGTALFNNTQFYVEKLAGVSTRLVVLENIHEQAMRITDLEVNLLSSDNKESTDLLVFTTNHVGAISPSDNLHRKDKAGFKKFVENKNKTLSKWLESEPVAHASGAKIDTITLNHIRQAKYLVLVFYGSENVAKGVLNKIKLIGAQGSIAQCNRPQFRDLDIVTQEEQRIVTDATFTVLVGDKKVVDSRKIVVASPPRSSASVCVSNNEIEFFENCDKITVEFSSGEKNFIHAIDAQLVKRSSSTSSQLKNVFESEEKLLKILEKFIQNLTKSGTPDQTRIQIIQTLIAIIESKEADMIPGISNLLNTKEFIENIILRSNNPDLIRSLELFFGKFNQNSEFVLNLTKNIKEILTEVEEKESNPMAISNFFKLVQFCSKGQHAEVLNSILGEIIVKSSKSLQNLDTKKSKILKALGISQDPYDPYSIMLAKQGNVNQGKSAKEVSSLVKGLEKIEYKASGVRTKNKFEFILDLRSQARVEKILFIVKNFINPGYKFNLNIKIYSLDQENNWGQALLSSKSYDESTINYMKASMRSKKMKFLDSNFLNSIGITFNNLVTSHLKFLVTIDCPYSNSGFAIKKQKILPVVLGARQGEKRKDGIFPQDFVNLVAKDFNIQGEIFDKITLNVDFDEPAKDNTKANTDNKNKEKTDSNLGLLSKMLESQETIDNAGRRAENVSNIKEVCGAMWTDILNDDYDEQVQGKTSAIFWKTVIKNVGQIVVDGKLKIPLENSEVNTFYSNILLQSSENELYNVVFELVKNVFVTSDDKKDLKSRLFSLIRHLCTPENAPLSFKASNITELVKILSNIKILKIELFINYIIKKLCKHYSEDPIKSTLQLNFILLILPNLIKFGDKMKVADPSTVTMLIQITLWLLEQDSMNLNDKRALLDKTFEFTSTILKRNNGLLNSYKFEKVHLEMLLIRTLKLNCFERFSEIIEFFNVSNNSKGLIENQKVILEIFCQILKQFFAYLKEPNEDNTLGVVISNSELNSDSTIKFLTFLSKFTHSIADKINKNDPEKIKIREKEKYNIRKSMQNMTPKEVAVHRSLSLSSQVPDTTEEEIIPGNLILEILQLIEDRYAENALSCNFFLVISKFVFTKAVSKGTLHKLMQLLVNLKKERLAMIISDIQAIAFNHYKKLKNDKENTFAFKRFGSIMIEVLVNLIKEKEQGIRSFNYEFHNFITRWFEITILGNLKMTPKISFTKVESILNSTAIKSLFSLTCQELMRSGNFGSKEGFNSLEKDNIRHLHWLDLALNILTKARVSDSEDTLLVASFSSIQENETQALETGFKNLFEWTILNSSPAVGVDSPAQILLGKLIANVNLIYKLAAQNTSTSKIMVKMFVELVAKLDDFIIEKIEKNEIGFVGANYLENLFNALGMIIDEAIVDDHMANFFTNECKGVEFILDRITNSSRKPDSGMANQSGGDSGMGILSKFGGAGQNQEDKNDLYALFNYDDSSSSKKKSKKSLVPRKNPTSFDVEFGNNLKMVETLNQKTNTNKDWQKFKRGSNRNLWFQMMKNETYKEVTLTFELPKPVDLTAFKIGFLTQWQDYTDKVVAEPSYVHLQYKEGNSWKYLCELKRIIDNGYCTTAVAIFHKNFLRVEGENSVDCINSICYPKKIRQFKVVIGRPEVSFQENYSMLRTRTFSNITVAISFVSILGADSSIYNISEIDREIRENNLLEIFSNLYSKNFSSMDKLAHSEGFISKVKPVFERIVDNYVKYFAPALINFSKNNVEFGNWILKKLLKISYGAPYAKLIGEIVLSNPNSYRSRLSMLLNFIFEEMETAVGKKSNAPSLFNFIGVFSACVFKAPEDLESINEQEGVTTINQKKIDQLLIGIKNFPYSQQMKKFIVTLLTIPQPVLKIDFENPMQFFIAQLVDKTQEGSYQYLDILSVLGLSSEVNSKIVLESKVWTAIKDLLDSDNESNVQNYMKFISNFVNNKEFFDRILEEEVDLKLFEYIKNKIVKKSGPFKEGSKVEILIKLAVRILDYVVVNSDERSERYADLLLKECNKINEYKDNFQTFLNIAFLPLINSVKTMKVSFKSPLKKLNKAVEETATVQEEAPAKELETNLILPEHKKTLESNLERLLEPSMAEKFKNGRWEKSLTTPSDNYDFTEEFNKNIIGKGPFLILLDGESMGNQMVLGIFCAKGIEKPKNGVAPTNATVTKSKNHFMFLYECTNQKITCHYKTNTNDDTFLKYSSNGSNDKGIMIMDSNVEKIYISAAPSPGPGTHIDLYPMKCLATDPRPNYEFPYDFHIKNGLEIWTLDTSFIGKDKKQEMTDFNIDTIKEDNQLLNLEYSYFSENMVYNLPSNLKVSNFKKALFKYIGKEQETPEMSLKIAKKEVEHGDSDTVETLFERYTADGVTNDVLEIEYPESVELKDTNFKALSEFYSPEMNLLKEFNKLKGFDFILDQCGEIIDNDWVGKKYFIEWKGIISDIKYYTKIKNFTSNFIMRDDSIETLMIIFTKDKTRAENWWEKKGENMFVNVYSAVGSIFEFDRTSELRENLIQDGIIGKLLQKLKFISKETSRKFIENFKEEDDSDPKTPIKKKEEMGEDEGTGKKKLEKRKGVGYGPGDSNKSTWTTKDYIELKNKKNKKIMTLINIMKNLLSSDNWIPHEKILKIFCESCILSLVENALRCSSLLEMAKEKELYEHYFELIDQMSQIELLIPALMSLDSRYQPKQIESIFSLLTKRAQGAKLFIQIGKQKEDEEMKGEEAENNKNAFELSQKLIEIYDRVEEIVVNSEAYKQKLKNEAMNYKDLPMRDAYKLLLKDQRFGYVDMKINGQYKHHWKSNFKDKSAPQASKMIRLAQEIADLSLSLPVDSTNAMFVRADEERLDVMKAIIFGAEGTPYAHGAFEYDIYFVENYPQASPKVNLETTGNGDVRFNPNLYSNGKVCLSLLGTWRGSASENWDPKLSNLNQILMSIQSVVMSEEVYFNEPGYQHEAGTESGEAKNEGYCNIVRLCNMKYAMIGHINNPPKGFEDVIRTHFYLKKDLILDSVNKWRKISENNDAIYKGLVLDHNYKYCDRFDKDPKKYFEEFDEQVGLLKQALDGLEAPSINSLLENKLSKKTKKREKKENIDITKDIIDFSNIDMTYDEDISAKLKEISIDDAGVKDRWSRYIGVMGMEAVKKQASACVMISGLDALGVEVAKNVILSGVKRLTLHDSVDSSYDDLSGQFFISQQDIEAGKNRAEACKNKIQQLNYYVRVDTREVGNTLPVDNEKAKELYADYNLLILVGKTHEEIVAASKVCEKEGKKLIVADCRGVFSRIFCYYGKDFMVFDKNGEEAQEVLIENIEVVDEEKAKVTLMKGAKSNYEDGNTVILDRIEGMEFSKEQLKDQEDSKKETGDKDTKITLSPNGNYYKVKTIKYDSFYIMGDFTKCTPYIRGGTAKLIKVPSKINFTPYHEIYKTNEPGFEMNLLMHDFMKLGHPQILHIAFNAYDEFLSTKKSGPEAYTLQQAKEFYAIAQKLAKSDTYKEMVDLEDEDTAKKFKNLIFRFALSNGGTFAPQCAYVGGIVAQEVIKAITGKFMPIKQLMYADSIEVMEDAAFPENIDEIEEKEYSQIVKEVGLLRKKDRYDGLRLIIGEQMLDKVQHSSLFMIGSGAIGCELLKNYAMIGFGVGKGREEEAKNEDGEVEKVTIQPGRITLTDPDVIEVSNLNRQFLFREKHLRKPKSLTAAAAALMMNPDLKGNIFARLDKVWSGTAHIYTDDFFEKLSIVTNALDNIQARRYIDMRCVAARTPLVESGTLGPKGHVQVVVPFKTESYGSMDDPEEEFEIPHCTLKMFPEETLHCVEWGRDLFGKYFTQEPKALKKCLELLESGETISISELKALKDAVNLGKQRPFDFDDCLEFARKKFQELFHNDIKQLLFVYPLDHQDKDGNPFWKLPKRPPHHLDYSPEDELHRQFVIAFACLRANIFGIELPEEVREKEVQSHLATIAGDIEVTPFVPSEEKAKEIAQENEKEEDKDKEEPEEVEEVEDDNKDEESYESLMEELKKIAKDIKSEIIKPEEFEKDIDTNFHIDSIHSMANLRASNYTLDPMDWMTVKIKAGRIIPALATTTASIAGLQTLELVKVLKEIKLEDIKNAFLNLAVPYLTQSEPAPVPKTKIREDYEVSIWDRWEFTDCKDKTLNDIFNTIIEENKLYPKDVIQGAKPIYMKSLGGEDVLKKKLSDLFDVKEGDHEDLTITCGLTEDTKEIIPGTPAVRLFF